MGYASGRCALSDDDCLRRFAPVDIRPGEGLLTEPTAVVQPWLSAGAGVAPVETSGSLQRSAGVACQKHTRRHRSDGGGSGMRRSYSIRVQIFLTISSTILR